MPDAGPLKSTPKPKSQSQSIGMQIGAQSAILNMEDTEDGKRYTMYIVEAEKQGTTGKGIQAYFVYARSVTLPQSSFQEALLALAGSNTS